MDIQGIITTKALRRFLDNSGHPIRLTEAEMERRYGELVERGRTKTSPGATSWEEKAKGAIWGMIVGDALGASIEFGDKLGHPWIEDMMPVTNWELPAGSWTDDASLGLCIMQAFLDNYEEGRFGVKCIADNFALWLHEGLWSSAEDRTIGVGRSCEAGIEQYSLLETLRNGREEWQGNGSIMRYAPSWFIGRKMYGHEKFDEGRNMPCDLLFDYAVNDLTHDSDVVRQCIARMNLIFDWHIRRGKRTGERTNATDWRNAGNSGWCVSTLDSALWAFNSTSSFEDALVAAVNLGGDADTIGSVAGQIAGSWYGYSAIPSRWIDAMQQRGRLVAFVDRFVEAVRFDEGKSAREASTPLTKRNGI